MSLPIVILLALLTPIISLLITAIILICRANGKKVDINPYMFFGVLLMLLTIIYLFKM